MTFTKLLAGSIAQLRNANAPVWLWVFAGVMYASLPAIGGLFGDEGSGDSVIAALLIPMLIGLIVLQWYLTRAIGNATDKEEGSVGAWFGWGILAYVPTLVIMLTYTVWDVAAEQTPLSDYPWWTYSLFSSLIPAFTITLQIHAAGRAIDFAGPEFGVCHRTCKPIYGLLIAAFLLCSIPSVAADGIYELSTNIETGALLAIASVVGGLLHMLSSIFLIALTTSVWRNVVASPSPAPTR